MNGFVLGFGGNLWVEEEGLSGTRSTHPPINWGPSLEREGGEEDCSGSASSFKPGGSKQP